MSFQRPTLAEIVTRVQADFVSRLGLVGAVLRRSMVYILARVVAGAVHMLHGHLDFLGRQIFPDLSEAEFLVRQASLYGITKTSPSFAEAEILITGTDGTVIPEGTTFTRADGTEYETTAEVVISGTDIDATVIAVLAGSAGTLVDGAVLSFQRCDG